MKLRNKKTGKIVDFGYLQTDYVAPLVLTTYENDKPEMYSYNSLAELNEDWEDYEEPEMFYWIDYDGKICKAEIGTMDRTKIKQIGNYFETKEEAEKLVEKLQAYKRLKDNGFTIRQWRHTPDMNLTTGSFINIKGFIPEVVKNMKDIDLLFSGEDD